MRACWTSSCWCWLTKMALTLPAYRGPSGAGSSLLVCLRVPWYTWGLIGCVKFSLHVWVYLSCWYCECYTVWWGCLRACEITRVRSEKGLDGLLLVFCALSWSVGFVIVIDGSSVHHDSGLWPSRVGVREESWTPPPVLIWLLLFCTWGESIGHISGTCGEKRRVL